MGSSVVQVTLTLSAALLIVRVLKHRPPRIRQAVLIVALVKRVCPPGWLPWPGLLAGSAEALADAGVDLVVATRGEAWLAAAPQVLPTLYVVGLVTVLALVARPTWRCPVVMTLFKYTFDYFDPCQPRPAPRH